MTVEDLRPVELYPADWGRLLEIAQLTASKQDIRILDALRRAVANGAHDHVEDRPASC